MDIKLTEEENVRGVSDVTNYISIPVRSAVDWNFVLSPLMKAYKLIYVSMRFKVLSTTLKKEAAACTIKIKVTGWSETMITTYETRQCRNPQDHNLNV
jgi:hypothetical protein